MKGYPGMKKLGRKPNTEPATAFDNHRAITLVQVLAMDKNDGLKLTDLQMLAVNWGLSALGGYSGLLQRLAQHALNHAAPDLDIVDTADVSR